MYPLFKGLRVSCNIMMMFSVGLNFGPGHKYVFRSGL